MKSENLPVTLGQLPFGTRIVLLQRQNFLLPCLATPTNVGDQAGSAAGCSSRQTALDRKIFGLKPRPYFVLG